MDIGLNARMIEGRHSLPGALDVAAGFGYDAYEIEIGIEAAPWAERLERWQERSHELRLRAEQAGIALGSLCLSVLWQRSLAAEGAAERGEAVRIVSACIRLATGLGAKVLLVPAGQPGGIGDEAARANMAASLKRCAPEAEDAGVVLAVENVCQRFLSSAAQLCSVVDEVGSAACAVYYDPGNQSFAGIDPVPEIRQLGPRIARLHAKDTTAVPRPWLKPPEARTTGDFSVWQRRTTVTLGQGEVDWARIAGELRSIRYGGGVVLEIPQPAETAEAGCRANLQAAKRLFGD